MHIHLTRPGTFDSVVAVSPSLWFGDGVILKEITTANAGPRPSRLIAEGDQPAPGGAANGGIFNAIVQQLRAADPAATVSYVHLPAQTHGTTMMAALAPAIRLAFGMEKQ
jgi:predicted alpha/beta superfamily hydrolase